MEYREITQEEFQSYYAQLHTKGGEKSLHTYLKLGQDEKADLSGADFSESGADLSGADLSGANLSGANFSGVDFTGANLSGADLSNSNVSGAKLPGANLSGASLSGTNLCGSDLSGANLGGADLGGADLCDAKLPGANLNGADLREADFLNADLLEANFQGAKLSGTKFIGAGLQGANFSNADLQEWIDFSGADLMEANFQGAKFKNINLAKAKLKGVNFSWTEFNEVDLKEADLSNTIFIGVKGLTEEQLTHAKQQGAVTEPEGLLLPLQKYKISSIFAYDVAKTLLQMAEDVDAPTRQRYIQAASAVINHIHSLPFEQQPEKAQDSHIKEKVLIPRIEKGLFKDRLPRDIVRLLVNGYLSKEDITLAASVSKTDVKPPLTADKYREISVLPESLQKDVGYEAVRQSFAEMVRAQRKQAKEESPDGSVSVTKKIKTM